MSSTTPTYHLTLDEVYQIRASAQGQKEVWPAVVIGDTPVKGNANAPDAPFLTDNLYFELDGDIDPDDGSLDWQQANNWLNRMKAALNEVFPIYSISVGGRGWHFPVRLDPDCTYFRNPTKFNLACPYGYAHIEVWAPQAGARNMIWGDVWFVRGEQVRLPLKEAVPIITDEVIYNLKGVIDFEASKGADIPNEGRYWPTREGAIARILKANILSDVIEPATLSNGATRYIRTEQGYKASLYSNAGRDRYLEIQKAEDDLIYLDMVAKGVPEKELKDWVKKATIYHQVEMQNRLFQSINGFRAYFKGLPYEVDLEGITIPTLVAGDLNRVTYQPDGYTYDPVMIYGGITYQASTGKVLEPDEVAARHLTTDLVSIPYEYPTEQPTGPLADLGREVYRALADANGKEFLILLLTKKEPGLGICKGDTQRGKTTLFNMLQALGLAYISPQSAFPDLFTRRSRKQADLFAKAEQALTQRRCVLIEEIATAFTEANFAPHNSPPNRLEEGGLKALTTQATLEYRNPYKEAITAPVLASILAVCNEAPVLFGIDDPAVLRRVWGFQAPTYSDYLAKDSWEEEHFLNSLTLQAFLYEFAKDCREVIPALQSYDIQKLPSVIKATEAIHQAIREQNAWYEVCRESKGKKKDEANLPMDDNVKRIVGNV